MTDPNIEKILIHGSFADLLHDFGEIVSKKNASNEVSFREDIYLGLPQSSSFVSTEDWLDSEEQFLLRILTEIGDNFVPDSKFLVDAKQTDRRFNTFELGKNKTNLTYYGLLQDLIDLRFSKIPSAGKTTSTIPPPSNIPVITTETFNNHEYEIKSRVVIQKKNSILDRIIGDKYTYHEPYPILKLLGIENNSAFVVDFAAISLPDFLTAPGASAEPLINLYFITNPETENDAAGKTGPTNPCYFTQPNNGIKIHSLQQIESAAKQSNYTWEKDNTTAYKQFFTKYNFALSDLIEVNDGKRIKLKTNLTITNEDMSESIPDSGNASNITFVKESIFKRIKNLFKKKERTDNFFVNSKFQHKRSGDWLQVLSCVNLKERAYKWFEKREEGPKPFDPTVITDVYFVTHDRIALGFALYLGLNAIYTHAATSAYYVFKNTKNLGSPEEREAGEIIEKLKLIELAFVFSQSNYDSYFDTVNTFIDQYNTKFVEFNNLYDQQIRAIISQINSTVSLKEIEDQELFKLLFKTLNAYVFFLQKYQTIDDTVFKNLVLKYRAQFQLFSGFPPDQLLYFQGVIAELKKKNTHQEEISFLQTIPNLLVSLRDPALNVFKDLINIHKQLLNESSNIMAIKDYPVPSEDTNYARIIDVWNLKTVFDKFHISNRDKIDQCKVKLSKIEYKKGQFNPFAVIWTDTSNRLPPDLKSGIHAFLKDFLEMRLKLSPFDYPSASNDDKKTYLIWHKLITELILKFYPNQIIPSGGAVYTKPRGREPPNIKEFSLPEISQRFEKKIPSATLEESPKLEDIEDDDIEDDDIEDDYIEDDDNEESPELEESQPLVATQPLVVSQPLVASQRSNAEFPDIHINAANVINEYMCYLRSIHNENVKSSSHKSSSHKSRKIHYFTAPLSDVYVGGAPKKTMSQGKNYSITGKSKKETLGKYKKKSKKQTVRKPHSMLLRNFSLFKEVSPPRNERNEIIIHTLFTEHSYLNLNHILLNDSTINPLLPLFMLTEALSVYMLNLTDDDELFQDYYSYYYFLNELYISLQTKVPNIYKDYYGKFLRYYLFTNFYLYDPSFMQTTYIRYRQFFSFTTMLSTYITGTVILDPDPAKQTFFDISVAVNDPDIVQEVNSHFFTLFLTTVMKDADFYTKTSSKKNINSLQREIYNLKIKINILINKQSKVYIDNI